ncbi:hypothetical protein Hdeb2414_s0024g00651101 [Helianthus debilis subsp. tardiflorus]
MLIDESDKEDEAEVNVEGDVCLSPESAKLLKSLTKHNAEPEKTAGDEEGDDDKSLSSSSDEEIDETKRAKRIKAEIEKEKQLKRKRKEDKDDELYNPSPEHVIESQTPPSSGGRKKASARKRVVTPKAAPRLKLLVKKKPIQEQSKPPTPPPEPKHQTSPIQSPPRQPSPLHLSPPHLSPPHLSPPHFHIATPPHEQQPVVTSQQIFQTPPSTQPPVQTTPGSSGYKTFPTVPEEKKVEEVLIENKKLLDREKKLEKRVKSVEAENSSLLKKVEADQTEIDILKVKVVELEEEKARRDEQNKYFELKNKELEAVKALKEHEIYMMNKVLESLLGKSVEQRFEEIQVEEVRGRRQAEIDAEMKNKGKAIEGVSDVSERSIVPEDVEEDNEEEEVDEDKTDDVDDVFSASSHIDDDNDDDDQGSTCIEVTEASNEENVDDYLHDDVNEEPEDATGEGENIDDQNVDKREKLILRLEPEVEEGETRHTYTMNDIIEMMCIDDPNFKVDFEEELNVFDMNQQLEYQYKYVEEADNYDHVEVEDCSDEENENVDTSNFPTLVEFFSQKNVDELRRKLKNV